MASKTVRGKKSTNHKNLSERQRVVLDAAVKIATAVVAKEGYKFPLQPVVRAAVQTARSLLDGVEQFDSATPLYKVQVWDDSLARRVASQLIRKGVWFELAPTINGSCEFTVHYHDASKLRELANGA